MQNTWEKLSLYGLPARKDKYSRKRKRKRKEQYARAKVNEFRKENLSNPTLAEKKFKNALKRLNIRFTPQKVIKARQKYRIADFYLQDYQTIIEIDGEYHNTPQQQKEDHDRTVALLGKQKVIRIIRFTNEEIMKHKDDYLAKRLTEEICPFVKPHLPLAWD